MLARRPRRVSTWLRPDGTYDRRMSLGARLSELFRRRRDETDPLEELEASYQAQAALLQQSRRGVADVVTARKRVEVQARSLEAAAERLRAEAQQAVDAGREQVAREALTRRAAVLQQAAALQPDLDRLRDQEDRLQAQVGRLEAKVEAFRAQKETLKATHSAAEAHTRIGEAYAGIAEEGTDVTLALIRARERTEQMQARADAVEQLGSTDAALAWESAGEAAERRLAQLAGADDATDVEAELARLRAGRPSGGISAGPTAEEAR
jgi:phage shock protein A